MSSGMLTADATTGTVWYEFAKLRLAGYSVPTSKRHRARQTWASPARVKLYETTPSNKYCAEEFSSGLLTQATVGNGGGVGGLRTKRSGWAA
jgi:hypothetical protein